MFCISLTVTITSTFPDCTSRCVIHNVNSNVSNNVTLINKVRNFMSNFKYHPAYWLRYINEHLLNIKCGSAGVIVFHWIAQRLHRLQLCPKQWNHWTAFTTDKDTSINFFFHLTKTLTHIWSNKCTQTAQICFKTWTDIWYYCQMRNYAVIRMRI